MIELLRVRQKTERHALADPEQELLRQLEKSLLAEALPAAEIAIAVPSRGISGLPALLGRLGQSLRACGATLHIFPAMGSHGGETPEDQVEQLRRLGVDEASTGIPVQTPGDYACIGRYAGGQPLFLPAGARKKRGLLLINRIKLHTIFTGPIQSGLGKLLAFGAGGPMGAKASHDRAAEVGLAETLSEAHALAAEFLWGGIGLVEDAAHQVAHIEATGPQNILKLDARLLTLAAAYHPRLPLQQGGLLIVERMGKDISGAGMDPHVLGLPPALPGAIQFGAILVRALTDASHGNALGIGCATYALQALAAQVDHKKTQANANTSGSLWKARMPMVVSSDQQALDLAWKTHPKNFLQIRDTLHLEEALVAGYPREQLSHLEILERLGPLSFLQNGNLQHYV